MTDYMFNKLFHGSCVFLIIWLSAIFFPILRIIYAVVAAIIVILFIILLFMPVPDEDEKKPDDKNGTKWVTFD